MHFAGVLFVLALLSGFAYLAFQLLSGPLARFVSRVLGFVGGVVDDVLRASGASVAFALLVTSGLWSVLVGRWAASLHYFRASKAELGTACRLFYRAGIRRPLELVFLGPMVRQVEDSFSAVVARAPGRDQRRGRDEFPGYRVIEALPSGGSGARLWLAEPVREKKKSEIARAQRVLPDRVVIKSFALDDGTELPQMLRENRALEAARRMGHVLEHGIDALRFYYVMPFVPGEDLRTRTLVLHERADRAGLDASEVRIAVGYVRDLLDDLERFHAAGLWHKDVKPENILVDHGRARLVDLGLVTPLASAMTLTTHGTEYYRDPELVREALKGTKVHEVDGVRFDLFGAGAILYSLIESTFPAHGVLSRFTKRCPDALAWIVRRAMADMHHRYASAREMRADVDAVLAAGDPFAMKPAELPSWRVETTTAPAADKAAYTAAEAELAAMPLTRESERDRLVREPLGPRVAEPPRRPHRVVRALLISGVAMFVLFSGAFFAFGARVEPRSPSIAEASTRQLSWRMNTTALRAGGMVRVATFLNSGADPQPEGGPMLVVDVRGERAREEGDALLAALGAEGIELHGIGGAPEDPALAKLHADALDAFQEYAKFDSRIANFGRLLQRRSARGLDGMLFLRASRAGGDERLEVFAAVREGISPLGDLLTYLPERIAREGR